MKLISCYIENYGKFSQKKIEFAGDINSFCEANGYGKTTICSFIKAMFYGLKPNNANTKEFNDRRRFYPFSAGKFGGNIIFENNGKTYRVERFFGEKSETSDEMTVYADGEKTEELGQYIGEKVFGLDKESFEKAVFIGSGDVEISSTSGINAKLGEYFYGDDVNVENAIKILEEKAKEYKKSKKAQDRISIEKERNDRLNAEVRNRRDIKNSLPNKYADYEKIEEEIKSLEEKIALASKEDAVFAVWENYERLKKEVAEQEEKAKRLKADFKAASLSKEDLTELEEEISELNKLNILRKEKENRPFSQKERRLKEKFGDKTPTESELKMLSEKIEEYKRAVKDYNDTTEVLIETVLEKQKVKAGAFALAIGVFAVLAIVGGILMFSSPLIGGIILALGVLGALTSAALFIAKKNKTTPVTRQTENTEKQNKKLKVDSVNRLIEGFLSEYGYNSDSVETDYKLFLNDFGEYCDLIGEEQLKDKEYKGIVDRAESLESKIKETFNRCGVFAVDYLKELGNIKSALKEIEFTEAGIVAKRKLAEEYKAEKNITDKPPERSEDLSLLQAQLKEKYDRKSIIGKDIDSAEREAEQLDYYVSEKEESDAKLEEYKKTYMLLTKTKEFLEESEKKITEKYVKPIKDELIKYSDVFEKAIGEKIHIDKNYGVSFDEGGKLRSEKHLSSGQRSVLALCYRLAIFMNMYNENPPFLIFDDPFTSLDDEHIQKVKSILKDVSSYVQILYFTCHKSRVI